MIETGSKRESRTRLQRRRSIDRIENIRRVRWGSTIEDRARPRTQTDRPRPSSSTLLILIIILDAVRRQVRMKTKEGQGSCSLQDYFSLII